jgi:hypothetical protein
VTVPRLFAIAVIFAGAALSWFTLGASITVRTGENDGRIAREVALLWGGPHVQAAPSGCIERPSTSTETIEEKDSSGKVIGQRKVTKPTVARVPAPLTSTRAEVALDLDHRQRGLLWYDTYGVAFHAVYVFRNRDEVERAFEVTFPFPNETALYDYLVFTLNGQQLPAATDVSKGLRARTSLPPGAEARLEVGYRSRGVGTWTYAFGDDGHVAQVRDFSLAMATDFDAIDFPAGTMSPGDKQRTGDGWKLTWAFSNLVTGQKIGMDLPNRLNPGPLASRITFFAPVSLLFFLAVMVMLGVTKGKNLHPMNYLFLAAAFFEFHLLLAYLVDHVSIHVAFATAAATSLALVISYLRIVTGIRSALLHAGAAQLVFLVLFSYAFFFEGYTGLTVTVGAVVTLFVLMQMTASVRWAEVFSSRAASHANAR